MALFNRLVPFLSSLIVAYFAVWAGDGMGTIDASTFIAQGTGSATLILGCWIAIFILSVIYLIGKTDGWDTQDNLRLMTLAGNSLPVLCGLAFGYMATPVTRFGNNPLLWHTPALFLLVIGFVPWAMELHAALLNKLRDDRSQALGENVHSIRRKD